MKYHSQTNIRQVLLSFTLSSNSPDYRTGERKRFLRPHPLLSLKNVALCSVVFVGLSTAVREGDPIPGTAEPKTELFFLLCTGRKSRRNLQVWAGKLKDSQGRRKHWPSTLAPHAGCGCSWRPAPGL